ncbi:MAG: transposase [Pseudomonadota bacterium]
MARKRFKDKDVLNLLRQIEIGLSSGAEVPGAYRKAGISSATYYAWRKKYGGMGKSQLQEQRALEKINT